MVFKIKYDANEHERLGTSLFQSSLHIPTPNPASHNLYHRVIVVRTYRTYRLARNRLGSLLSTPFFESVLPTGHSDWTIYNFFEFFNRNYNFFSRRQNTQNELDSVSQSGNHLHFHERIGRTGNAHFVYEVTNGNLTQSGPPSFH